MFGFMQVLDYKVHITVNLKINIKKKLAKYFLEAH